MDKATLEKSFAAQWPSFLDDWKAFLRFDSISTDPAYHQRCLDCANWLVGHLNSIGMAARLLETPTKPVVFAEWKGQAGKPVVIFYGHYDVQPVDPLELWESKPFEPTMRGDRLYARGAQDNKGQVTYVIKALETLIKAKALGCTVRMFIEGEEECGSEGIAAKIPDWKELLKGDVLMVCDTGMVPTGAPTVTMGLRGIAHLTVKLTGASHDLHSGVHGGVAPNPALGMARLLATLHDSQGRIAVKGFYNDVEPVGKEDLELSKTFPITDQMYQALTGVSPVGGEQGLGIVERGGFRPTIEINGVHSGYGGPGSKTIIPSEAIAKISTRLVAGQDPEKSLQLIEAHLRANTPAGLKLEIDERAAAGVALRISAKSGLVQKARAVLDQVGPVPTAFRWEGASIPIVAALRDASRAEPLLVGFGAEQDRIHAPNESFSIDQFRRGFLYAGMMLGGI